MIKNKILIAIALCAGISPMISLGSEKPTVQLKAPQSLSDWAYSKGANLWKAGSQKLSQAKSYAASFIPQSIKNTVGTWSPQTQISVALTTIGFLALAGYNKDALMQMFSNAYDNAPDLGIAKGATTLYSHLPRHAQSGLQRVNMGISQYPKMSAAAVTGTAIYSGIVGANAANQEKIDTEARKTTTQPTPQPTEATNVMEQIEE